MKKLYFLSAILLIFAGSFVSCENKCMEVREIRLYRYIFDERVYLNVCPYELLIIAGENVTKDDIKSFFYKNGSLQVADISAVHRYYKLVRFYNGNRNKFIQFVNRMQPNDTVLFIGLIDVCEWTGRKLAALTQQITVSLKCNEDLPILLRETARYDIVDIQKPRPYYSSLRHTLTINHHSGIRILQLANRLNGSGLFEWASVNYLVWIWFGSDDTHFHHQWGLYNTGQLDGTVGIDIRAQQAWRTYFVRGRTGCSGKTNDYNGIGGVI